MKRQYFNLKRKNKEVKDREMKNLWIVPTY